MPISNYTNSDEFIRERDIETTFREYNYTGSGADPTNTNFLTSTDLRNLVTNYYSAYSFINPPNIGTDFVRGKDVDWTPQSIFSPFQFTTANGYWESGLSDSPSATITQDYFINVSLVDTF